jgi:pantoate--beta-alanine ligase
MIISKTIGTTRKIIHEWKQQNAFLGLVPTMGFLHEGHVSLIREARKHNDKVVVSIFVNPTQFGPNEDFKNYPRNFHKDATLCEKEKVDMIFHPEVEEMYPEHTYTHVDVHQLGETLCGATRPGHFRGVCTVVSKLFNIVSPERAYFGEKDAQQLIIIKKLVQDLNLPIQIIPCPTVREENGLALSSRNSYLSPNEQLAALVIPKSLELAKERILHGETKAETIRSLMHENINKVPLATIDYVSIVDAQTLNPIEIIQGHVLLAVAVYIGKTRLIDNFQWQMEA